MRPSTKGVPSVNNSTAPQFIYSKDIYDAFFEPPCDFPFRSKEGVEETKKLARQTLRNDSKEELSQTCMCISHIINSATPNDQKQCIEVLDAFPWDNPYNLKLFDSSVPLHALLDAVNRELPEIIGYLVKKRGVDVNTLSSEGLSALILAVKRERVAIVELLLSLNANPFLHSPAGKRAIQYVDKFTPTEIFEMLSKREKELIADNPSLAVYAEPADSASESGHLPLSSNRYNCSYLKREKKGEYFKLSSADPEETSRMKLKKD